MCQLYTTYTLTVVSGLIIGPFANGCMRHVGAWVPRCSLLTLLRFNTFHHLSPHVLVWCFNHLSPQEVVKVHIQLRRSTCFLLKTWYFHWLMHFAAHSTPPRRRARCRKKSALSESPELNF